MEIKGVTIVIPTYNRPETLKASINSILRQTYSNWELIVVDDASSIDVKPYMDELMKNHPLITYHKNKSRKGPSGSRNVGISLSKFDYLIFIDDDIILMPDVLELLTKDLRSLLDSHINVGAIAPACVLIDMSELKEIMDGLPLKKKIADPYLGVKDIKISRYTGMNFANFSPEFEKLQVVPHVHGNVLYSKKALTSVEGYDENLYKGNFLFEDLDLAIRVGNKYLLYFEPKAVIYHLHASTGGCRVDNKYKHTYYFISNWIKYIIKNYRWRSIYMIPSVFVWLVYRGVQKTSVSISKQISL
jgi:glycosyltransferase involved in cell wall biosynthesis